MSPLPKLLLLLGARVTGTSVWREQMRRHDLSHTEANEPTAAAWMPLQGFNCPDHLSNRPVCNLPPGCIRLHAEPHGPSFTGKLGKFILFCWKIFTKTNEMFLRDEEIANFLTTNSLFIETQMIGEKKSFCTETWCTWSHLMGSF